MEIDRHVWSQRVPQPVFRVGVVVRVRTVRRVPAIALAQDPLPVADPVAIRDVGADDCPRRRGADRGVATEVVDVGVGDQHVVEVGRVEPQLLEGGKDHLVGRRHDAGVDQERPLIAQQVLRERARSQDALDAVDARGDLVRRHRVAPRRE